MNEHFENYTNFDILNLFYIYGECNRIVDRTCRVFNDRNPQLPPMSKKKFRKLESKFLQFGIAFRKTVPKPVTEDDDNEINVLAYFTAYPRSSIGAASQDLGISKTSIHRILKKHKMHPFSFIVLQALRPGDSVRRTEFCEFLIIRLQENPNFLSRIIWTDESKFTREGVVNRRNLHHWAQENPHNIREGNYQDSFSFNVFCLIMDNSVRFKIYTENLTSDRYSRIIREVVTDFIDDLPLNVLRECWYQMDGAPAHSSHNIDIQLTNLFEDRWMGRYGPYRWPPRSPDLSPLDFFIWGYIKSQVYSQPILNLEDLRNKVQRAFINLNPEQIRKATNGELHKRILLCLEKNGGHIEQCF